MMNHHALGEDTVVDVLTAETCQHSGAPTSYVRSIEKKGDVKPIGITFLWYE